MVFLGSLGFFFFKWKIPKFSKQSLLPQRQNQTLTLPCKPCPIASSEPPTSYFFSSAVYAPAWALTPHPWSSNAPTTLPPSKGLATAEFRVPVHRCRNDSVPHFFQHFGQMSLSQYSPPCKPYFIIKMLSFLYSYIVLFTVVVTSDMIYNFLNW